MSTYLRVAALKDSTTSGIGDPVVGGWRGWSRLLVGALAASYDVSLCVTVAPGATTPLHATYGGLRLDLAQRPEVHQRAFWAVDRLHPSELGHRALARAYADLLAGHGCRIEPPSAACSGGVPRTWRRDARWLLAEGGPWVGRRARDLGPWAAQAAWTRTVRAGATERRPLGSRP